MAEDGVGGGVRPWSPAIYVIEVAGSLPETCVDLFAGMRITVRGRDDSNTVTRLEGRLADQAALTGMLDGLAELHLPILTVHRVPGETTVSAAEPHEETES